MASEDVSVLFRSLLQPADGSGGGSPGQAAGGVQGSPHAAEGDQLEGCGGAGEFALGVVMTLCGAAVLAIAMVTQRYALTYPTPKVPLLCVPLPRNGVWFVGLLLYGVANALKVLALPYGPWSVLSSVWTTLLVFNLLFAHLFLREKITWVKGASSVIILSGAVLCVLGTPPADGCDSAAATADLSASDFMELLLRPAGLSWFLVLAGAVLGSVVAIVWYERRYPFSPEADAASAACAPAEGEQAEEGKLREADEESIPDSVIHAKPGSLAAADDALTGAAMSSLSSMPQLSAGGEQQQRRQQVLWLHRTMAFAYPASLGLDEGVADLLIKGWTAMLSVCTASGEGCGAAALWVSIVLWVVSAFASAFWWMPKVFRRYEVTIALPVEYGSLNFANVCTGLLFYAEYESMTPRQLSLVVGGLAVILCGIAVGQLRR